MRDSKIIPVDPENTSSRSPNSRHVELVGYKNIELEGVAISRDVITSWNIALKATEVEARRF